MRFCSCDDVEVVVLAGEVLANLLSLDFSQQLLTETDVTTLLWPAVHHHGLRTSFLYKVEHAYSAEAALAQACSVSNNGALRCCGVTDSLLQGSLFFGPQVSALSRLLWRAAETLSSQSFTPLLAEACLSQLFEPLRTLFTDYALMAEGWVSRHRRLLEDSPPVALE